MMNAPTDLVLPNNAGGTLLTTIDTDAFKDKNLLTTLIIPESYAFIKKNAFNGCTNLSIYVKGQLEAEEPKTTYNDDPMTTYDVNYIGNVKSIHVSELGQIDVYDLAGIYIYNGGTIYAGEKCISGKEYTAPVYYKGSYNRLTTKAYFICFDKNRNPVPGSFFRESRFVSNSDYFCAIDSSMGANVRLPYYIGEIPINEYLSRSRYIIVKSGVENIIVPRGLEYFTGSEETICFSPDDEDNCLNIIIPSSV